MRRLNFSISLYQICYLSEGSEHLTGAYQHLSTFSLDRREATVWTFECLKANPCTETVRFHIILTKGLPTWTGIEDKSEYIKGGLNMTGTICV